MKEGGSESLSYLAKFTEPIGKKAGVRTQVHTSSQGPALTLSHGQSGTGAQGGADELLWRSRWEGVSPWEQWRQASGRRRRCLCGRRHREGVQSGVGEQPHLADIKEAQSENEVPRTFTPLSVEGTEMAVKTDREAMEGSRKGVSAAGGSCQLSGETGCRARDLWPTPSALVFSPAQMVFPPNTEEDNEHECGQTMAGTRWMVIK